MDLLELRYFVEIADAGSLSRAAIRLGVSQPALSRQLRNLETELRAELFYRHGRGVALTEAGRRLHATGTEILQKLHGVKDDLLARNSVVTGGIALGLPPSIAATLGARLATTFGERYPEAELHIRESFSGVLVEWVESGRLDLAVLYDARRGPSMLVTPLLLEDLFLIEPPGAGTATPATLAELGQRKLVLPGPENGLRRVFDAACRSAQMKPRIAMQIDCVAALKQIVEEGGGCTILPYGAVHREVRDGRLSARPFRAANMRAMLVVATPSHRPVTRLAKLVLDLLRSEVRELAEAEVLRGTVRGLAQRKRAAAAGA
jgi:LysR family nitrogen assimilation transcriptional regulator